MKKIKAQAEKDGENMEAFMKGISPHALRHTYATTLYYAGVDVKTAQYLLGHTSVAMTLDLYTTLQHENDKTGIEKLNIYRLKPVD